MKFIFTSLLLITFVAAHSQTDSAVYFNTEITATFPGGKMAWQHYLQKNLTYPDLAVSNGIQGTVVVQFMVDSTGIAHEITVISGPKELREESVRLIKMLVYGYPELCMVRK